MRASNSKILPFITDVKRALEVFLKIPTDRMIGTLTENKNLFHGQLSMVFEHFSRQPKMNIYNCQLMVDFDNSMGQEIYSVNGI